VKFSVHDHCETLVSAPEVKGRIAWWVKKARRTQMSVDGVTIRKTRTLEGVHSRPGTLLRVVFSTVTKAKVLIRNLPALTVPFQRPFSSKDCSRCYKLGIEFRNNEVKESKVSRDMFAYELAVTDRHTIWLEGVTMHETGFSQFLIFLDEKKGNGIGLGPGGHIQIFVAKSFMECARSKLCRLIGCAGVLVGHSTLLYQNLISAFTFKARQAEK
jgi:hypothetical protein